MAKTRCFRLSRVAAVLGLLGFTSLLGIDSSDARTHDWRLGLNLGSGVSWVTDDGIVRYSPSVGMSAEYIPLGRPVRVQTGLRWERKGQELESISTADPVSDASTLDYISVPIFFAVYPRKDRTGPFAGIGTYLGALLHAEVDPHGGDTQEASPYRNFDFGLSIGGGYSFGKTVPLTMQLRYDWGQRPASHREAFNQRVSLSVDAWVFR